jgi:hypothetical protein
MRGRRAALAAVAGGLVLAAAIGCQSSPSGPEASGTPSAPPARPRQPPGPCSPKEVLVPPCGAWWGISTPTTNGSLSAAVGALEAATGRRFDLVYDFHDMSVSQNGMLLPDNQRSVGQDRILLLAWVSEEWSTGSRLSWSEIAAGALDATVIDPQAQRIKAYGKPVMLAFDPEMDLRAKEGAGTPEEYIAAYKHIQDRFAAIGARNVVWVWIVTGYPPTLKEQKKFYPGSDRVDWIGFDQYNFFTCQGSGAWKSFKETIKPTYDWFQANGLDDKPIILSEFGTVDDPAQPNRKAEWFADVPGVVKDLPGIKAVVQWNSEARGCNFTLTGPGVLSAYAKAGKDPYFTQPLP